MHISPNDHKQYRYITLNNHLRVLLIHDYDAHKSAAALAINVGHFDDPVQREGLAHYLEHMLFLGTEKYPNSGEFQAYISQHGGKNNAWTGTEHTCFFFDINAEQFDAAIDRFSQFFIAPLFNQEALDKERQAVESEYQLKLKDDMRRLYQVHKELVNPAHPFAKFSVGNLDTLSDHIDDQGQVHTIRDEIIDFYQQHYSADLMTLSLIGPQSLDQLEALAQQHFSTINNQKLAGKTITTPLLLDTDYGRYVQVEPEKDTRKLVLTFSLPGMNQFYRSKPLSYFANLIGDEGPGSLLEYLKQQQLITSLSAGGGISGSNFREFTISCTLTKQGLASIDDIINSIFYYLELIKQSGFAKWRYQEKKAVLESAFRFQEAGRPLDVVSHLVVNMQNYAPEDVIYGDYMMSGYDEAQLQSLLPYFDASKMRVMVIAKKQHFDREAKWYFTPYSVTDITPQQLSRWLTPPAEGLPLTLAAENPYICYQLDPAPLEERHHLPQLIEQQEGFRLWHLQETEFRVPKGLAFIAIDSPHAVSSPRKIVKTRLCVEMFLDALSHETYQAEIAGMGYNIYAHQGGVTLMLSGFSQKQPQLLDVIIDKFSGHHFSQARFDSIKTQLLRNWRNTAKDRPISQLFNAMTGILQPNNPPYPVLIEVLESIEMDEMPAFVEAMFAELHVEMFVYGDWTKQGALELAQRLKTALHVKNQRYEESLRPLVMLGKNGTFQREVLCNQADSALVLYYQSPNFQPKSLALYTLANHLMSAAFFHEIRTKQQLGYMVGTGNMPLNRHPGLALYVQSPNAAPSELLAAVDEFLNAFYMVILELNEQQWQSSKEGLLNQITAPDSNLRARGQRFWVAIGNKDLEFNNRDLVVEQVIKLDRSEMMRFIVNTLKPRTANRLVMHTQGNNHQDAEPLAIGQEIGSIDEFQLRPKNVDLG